jgi:mutator protein MutT
MTDRSRVVAAVVERDGRLLIARRAAHKRHGGLWEFPGGKIEAGESVLIAARRELLEELGLDVHDVGTPISIISDPGSHFDIEFVPVFAAGEPTCHEHSAVAWVRPADLLNYPLAPSDKQFAATLTDDTGGH